MKLKTKLTGALLIHRISVVFFPPLPFHARYIHLGGNVSHFGGPFLNRVAAGLWRGCAKCSEARRCCIGEPPDVWSREKFYSHFLHPRRRYCSIERTCNTCFSFRENMTSSSRTHNPSLRSSPNWKLSHCPAVFLARSVCYTALTAQFLSVEKLKLHSCQNDTFNRVPINNLRTPRRVGAGGTTLRLLPGLGWPDAWEGLALPASGSRPSPGAMKGACVLSFVGCDPDSPVGALGEISVPLQVHLQAKGLRVGRARAPGRLRLLCAIAALGRFPLLSHRTRGTRARARPP